MVRLHFLVSLWFVNLAKIKGCESQWCETSGMKHLIAGLRLTSVLYPLCHDTHDIGHVGYSISLSLRVTVKSRVLLSPHNGHKHEQETDSCFFLATEIWGGGSGYYNLSSQSEPHQISTDDPAVFSWWWFCPSPEGHLETSGDIVVATKGGVCELLASRE